MENNSFVFDLKLLLRFKIVIMFKPLVNVCTPRHQNICIFAIKYVMDYQLIPLVSLLYFCIIYPKSERGSICIKSGFLTTEIWGRNLAPFPMPNSMFFFFLFFFPNSKRKNHNLTKSAWSEKIEIESVAKMH